MSEGFDRVRAAELLAQNPLLTELLARMKADAVSTWQGSSHAGQREEQWVRYKVVEAFEAQIKSILDDAMLRNDRAQRAERLRKAER
jgi:hypothetical protein